VWICLSMNARPRTWSSWPSFWQATDWTTKEAWRPWI
jgi:hypothetical protein